MRKVVDCGRLRSRPAWSLMRTVIRKIGRERIRRQFVDPDSPNF
jgi:hypothetical protein